MYEDRDMRSISEKYADAFIKDDTDDDQSSNVIIDDTDGEEEDYYQPSRPRFIPNIRDYEEGKCCDCNKFLKLNKEGGYFKRCYECGIKHKESFMYSCSRCHKPMENNYPNCFDCRKIIEANYKYKCKVCNKKMEKNFPTCFTCRTKSGKVSHQ